MRAIAPTNNNGSIQLKLSWGGKRYSFNPVPGGHYTDKRDLLTAQAIATKIQNDILANNFDPTLDRYRLSPKLNKSKPVTLIEIWDLWVESLELPAHTKADHYHWVRQMILKAKLELTSTTWLTTTKLAPRTYNERLGMLKACFDWAVSQSYVESNPYIALKSRKGGKAKVVPFTLCEAKSIFDGFREHYPHYLPFVLFLMTTGTRTAEAIGLRWKHIDLATGTVTISESMPRDLLGNGYTRIRKDTKTGNTRCFVVPKELLEVIINMQPSPCGQEDLVFLSPKGCIIDADNFRERQWKRVLEKQGIPYRKPYTARHTMISHAIEKGVPITGLAYLVGHKDTSMIIKTYGHMVNKPELPTLF
ncbi:tyrosine recombinase XerC [Calothrix sp. PCC 7507]|uniref:site-specific integrase n=1 Tax=Calothrix sp. PCC 7507 TaxID=99598 RepID=UPI00029EF670|nr:site-specific integrase [Calothrix sp. PCC 7507]AFY31803.1 integrase family protein [Calothrix sp. PCC 7507]